MALRERCWRLKASALRPLGLRRHAAEPSSPCGDAFIGSPDQHWSSNGRHASSAAAGLLVVPCGRSTEGFLPSVGKAAAVASARAEWTWPTVRAGAVGLSAAVPGACSAVSRHTAVVSSICPTCLDSALFGTGDSPSQMYIAPAEPGLPAEALVERLTPRPPMGWRHYVRPFVTGPSGRFPGLRGGCRPVARQSRPERNPGQHADQPRRRSTSRMRRSAMGCGARPHAPPHVRCHFESRRPAAD